MNLKQTSAILRYAWNQRRLALLVAGAVALWWLHDCWPRGSMWTGEFEPKFQSPFVSGWNNNYNAFAGLATLAVALSVWIIELNRDWKESLPKKLTVTFVYASKVVMLCRDADLADTADMRALAQQIGAQMAGKLDFKAPVIRYSAGKVISHPERGFYMAYDLEFPLTKLPARLNAPKFEGELGLLWEPPFPDEPAVVPYTGLAT